MYVTVVTAISEEFTYYSPHVCYCFKVTKNSDVSINLVSQNNCCTIYRKLSVRKKFISVFKSTYIPTIGSIGEYEHI